MKRVFPLKSVVEWILIIVVAYSCAKLLQSYVGGVVHVRGSSMVPTFSHGDVLLVDKRKKVKETIQRGDIVIADIGSVQIIKRVIGLPGDELAFVNNILYVNGKPLNEPYLFEKEFQMDEKVVVPKNHLYLLGDNRNHSSDSRYLGPLPYSLIRGKALLDLFPTTSTIP